MSCKRSKIYRPLWLNKKKQNKSSAWIKSSGREESMKVLVETSLSSTRYIFLIVNWSFSSRPKSFALPAKRVIRIAQGLLAWPELIGSVALEDLHGEHTQVLQVYNWLVFLSISANSQANTRVNCKSCARFIQSELLRGTRNDVLKEPAKKTHKWPVSCSAKRKFNDNRRNERTLKEASLVKKSLRRDDKLLHWMTEKEF